jgi:NADH-quinone oxidoreductase subunit G
LAGNVVDLCPVGALCSKDFLYKQRVWFLKSQKSVCADCSTGCSIHVDHNKDIVYRLRPRENPQAQGYFMCDEGRYGFHYVNSSERILQPVVRESQGNGSHGLMSYSDITGALRRQFGEATGRDGTGVAAVISPFLTCEEAYLLAMYMKALSPQAGLAMGPVPLVGDDDTYPKDRHGRPVQPINFTIHAEKCPNRKGVEAILRHFQGDLVSFGSVLEQAAEGRLQALYLAGGYPPRPGGWITETQTEALRKVPLLVVQDLFPSPASAAARYVLPAASFAEKDGTFVNHKGLAQALHWAIRPPRNLRTDGQVYLDLLERRGLFHAPSLRVEMARVVPYFAPLAEAELGEHGIMLDSKA